MLPEINEPIETIVLFEKGQVRPLRFRWQQRVYKIVKIYSVWHHQEGRVREVHMTVEADAAQIMELVMMIDGNYISWQLRYVHKK